jgi:VanZ family protein
MTGFPSKIERFALVGWIAGIFFSSTSLAGRSSDEAFHSISRFFGYEPDPDAPDPDRIHFLAEKSVHIVLFSVLGILLWRRIPNRGQKVLTSLLSGTIIGAFSEFLQRFFPERDPAISDVLINIGGTAVGIAVCEIQKSKRDGPTVGDSGRSDGPEHSTTPIY